MSIVATMLAMTTTQKSKETRAEIAHSQLKTAILENEMPAGSQAMEPELAIRYGVSRATIREALIRLEAEGLIEIVPRRGARVLPLVADDMREIYQLLISLESDAAFELATHGLTKEEFERLTLANNAMVQALDEEDLSAWAVADNAFHRGILDIHGNKRLGKIVTSLMNQAHRARLVTRKFRPLPTKSIEEHVGILNAIRLKDADTARQLFKAHRKRSAHEILEILEKLPQV